MIVLRLERKTERKYRVRQRCVITRTFRVKDYRPGKLGSSVKKQHERKGKTLSQSASPIKGYRFRITQQDRIPISRGTYWEVKEKTRGHYVCVYIKSCRRQFYEATPCNYLRTSNDLPLVKVNPFFKALYSPKASFLVTH